MDFPRHFHLAEAIELGQLIVHAYGQFQSFEQEQDWEAPPGYQIIRHLTYTWQKSSPVDSSSWVDKYWGKILKASPKKVIHLPIGFIAQKRNRTYIVFRGTRTPKEWLNNLNTRLVPHGIEGFGNVHEGILSIYQELRQVVLESLADLSRPRRILVTGHSLGGAFATLAALDVEQHSRNLIRVLYTFGSPRLGDGRFAAAFSHRFGRKSFRLANSSDIVTEIPFPVPVANLYGGYFSHIDTPVVINIQKDDIGLNHSMETYLDWLRTEQQKRSILSRILRR